MDKFINFLLSTELTSASHDQEISLSLSLYFFSEGYWTALEPIQLVSKINGGFFLAGGKWPRHADGHSSVSSAEITKTWNYTSISLYLVVAWFVSH